MFIVVLGALMACLVPANAQTMQFQSTSSMRGTGSAYTPQVTAVGATSAASQATTTTESYSPAKAPGMKRGYDANGNWTPDSDDFGGGAETGESNQFPLGDAVIPLAVMALAFCGYIAIRRRKTRA